MTTARITLSSTYVQDDHQRMQENLARAIDAVPAISTGSYKTEVRLGYVYVTSTTAGQTQQCIETLTLVNASAYQAKYYFATIPFRGSVVALVCDCQTTIASAQTITLYRNSKSILSLNIAASATNGVVNQPKGTLKFNANDTFYATVTYASAVSSTTAASFIKLYVEIGS